MYSLIIVYFKGKGNLNMAKHRLKLIVILLALLLVGTAMYIYFERFAPVTMEEKVQIDIWYVSDDAAWQKLPELVDEYNDGEGKESGVSVTLREFADEAALNAAISSKDDLPNIVVCKAEAAALLNSDGKLADIDEYFDSWRCSEFPEKYINAAKMDSKLVGIPVLSETDLLIVNTELFKDTESLKTYEQLCALSEEYYKRNDTSFYTIEDYADFFRLMVQRLGGDFDAVSPHDSDDEDCIHIYNDLLAFSALNRGFDVTDEVPAKSVIDGKLPCAIVSTASIAKYISEADGKIEFLLVPNPKDGDDSAIERITLLSVCKSNENEELASCLFIEWLTSADINTKLAKDSGYFSVSGENKAGETQLLKKLFNAMDDIVSDDDTVIYPPRLQYAENREEFNLNLATLMDGLRNK